MAEINKQKSKEPKWMFFIAVIMVLLVSVWIGIGMINAPSTPVYTGPVPVTPYGNTTS